MRMTMTLENTDDHANRDGVTTEAHFYRNTDRGAATLDLHLPATAMFPASKIGKEFKITIEEVK